jgi:hypothetical protein
MQFRHALSELPATRALRFTVPLLVCGAPQTEIRRKVNDFPASSVYSSCLGVSMQRQNRISAAPALDGSLNPLSGILRRLMDL